MPTKPKLVTAPSPAGSATHGPFDNKSGDKLETSTSSKF